MNEGVTYNSPCTLCPRECKANRRAGQTGYCGVVCEGIYCARAALHFGEEPCIGGKNGAGAVFFYGCNLGCVYCQNYQISHTDVPMSGKMISVDRLAEIFSELEAQGADALDLVTPTQYVPDIIEALKMAKAKGLSLPVVYNCGGYEKVETLRLLDGLVDIYLPDFKYMNSELSTRYSGAADYPERAKEALAEMVRQTGPAQIDSIGIMRRGVLVRHLLLPGHVQNAKNVVKYLYETYGNQIYISLLNQYTPVTGIKVPELARRVTRREYERLVQYVISLGVENAFIQEGNTAKVTWIPEFNGEGL